MKTLLNKIDVKNTFWDNIFLLGKIILVLTFNANVLLGVRILPLYKKTNGKVVRISDAGQRRGGFHGGATTYSRCMELEVNTLRKRLIHTKYQNAYSFEINDMVSIWYYKSRSDNHIAQAKRGDEILIKHNDLLANIVFVLMVGSFLIVLFELFLKKILSKSKDG